MSLKEICILIVVLFCFIYVDGQNSLSFKTNVLPHNEQMILIEIIKDKYFLNIEGICTLTPEINTCSSLMVINENGDQEMYRHLGNRQFDFATIQSTVEYKDTVYVLCTDLFNVDIDWNLYLTNINGDSLKLLNFSNFQGTEAIVRGIKVDEEYIYVLGVKANEPYGVKIFVLKLDRSGNIIKEENFTEFAIPTNNNTLGDFIKTSNGNFIFTNRYYLSDEYDYKVGYCEFDKDLNIISSQYLPLRGNDAFNIDARITETKDGGFVMSTGLFTADSVFQNPEYYWGLGKWPVMMYRFNNVGNIMWTDTLYTKNIENETVAPRQRVNDIITAKNGDIIGVGEYNHPLTEPKSWGWLFRYNSEGQLLWEHFYEEKDYNEKTLFRRVIETKNNEIICIGDVMDKNGVFNNRVYGWLLRLDSLGCYESGCWSDSLTKVTTAILELPNPDTGVDIVIRPNPACSEISVDLPEDSIREKWGWKLFNLSGELIKQGKNNNSLEFKITRLDSFAPGIYFIHFRSASGKMGVKKLIIL